MHIPKKIIMRKYFWKDVFYRNCHFCVSDYWVEKKPIFIPALRQEKVLQMEKLYKIKGTIRDAENERPSPF